MDGTTLLYTACNSAVPQGYNTDSPQPSSPKRKDIIEQKFIGKQVIHTAHYGNSGTSQFSVPLSAFFAKKAPRR